MKISAATLRTPVAGDMVPLAGTGGLTTAFKAYLQPATDALPGLIELATTAEVQAGTDTGRAVTPAGLKEYFNQAVPISATGSFDFSLERTGGGTFRIGQGGGTFDGQFDDVGILSFNMEADGSRLIGSLPGFGIFMEYDFYYGGIHQSEWQVRFTTAAGVHYRPVQFNCAWNYANAYWWFRLGSSGNSFFRVDDAITGVNYFLVDSVQKYVFFTDINGIYFDGSPSGGGGYWLGTQYANDLRLLTANAIRVVIPAAMDGFTFGSAGDTNLYRSAANTLKTDDDLLFTGSLGPILADRSDGHTYRIKVTAGTLGTEVVT